MAMQCGLNLTGPATIHMAETELSPGILSAEDARKKRGN